MDRAFAWTRGRLSYQLQPLDEVARDLHRWYGLDIVVTDTALARLRITMTLDHATADDAVQRLVETLGGRYHRVGNTVRLGE
ncbi:MAG: DUF4974 domain-containing protein [Gemmatimonadaceae bacterium]|nr:DUF4974 domain-containing protein [Gemmatimonadaceae bacterium]